MRLLHPRERVGIDRRCRLPCQRLQRAHALAADGRPPRERPLTAPAAPRVAALPLRVAAQHCASQRSHCALQRSTARCSAATLLQRSHCASQRSLFVAAQRVAAQPACCSAATLLQRSASQRSQFVAAQHRLLQRRTAERSTKPTRPDETHVSTRQLSCTYDSRIVARRYLCARGRGADVGRSWRRCG